MCCSTKNTISHVAIIPDGNRRWAVERGYPKVLGHKFGGENVVDISLEAVKYGIKYITFFLFSTENFGRKQEELDYLFGTLKKLNKYSFNRLCDADCKIKFIDELEGKTADNTGLNINFCLNYGSRQEIVNAAKKCIELGIKPEELTMDFFRKQMYAPDFPDPDILIRTSGELRISNFLLWQLAYTEMFFVDKFWPAFSTDDFGKIVDEFLHRERRYGL